MSQQLGNSIIERTLKGLVPLLYEVAGSRRGPAELSFQPDLNDTDVEKLKCWIDSCLSLQGGEVAARARAAVLGRSYLQLNQNGRRRFLLLLVDYYGTDDALVEQRYHQWHNVENEQRVLAGNQLRDALEPPYMALLSQFTELADGMKFLVDMRAELLELRRSEPGLTPLEADFKRLLTSWFDIGLLQLEPIDWRSSAELLEKLIDYEAVHAVQSWNDMKHRLGEARRCFAFFHPNMPGEPLIFVSVALVEGLSNDVQTLLDEQAPRQEISKADTAIFYSITNAQKGLTGISFGNFLIKRVVAQLQQELPKLKQFATLSPMPGFCRWLTALSDEVLTGLPGGREWVALPEPRLPDGWQQDELLQQQLRRPLTQLAAHYLGLEKRDSQTGHPCTALNPVAHFHLGNGAQLEQVNWMADRSDKGLKQSAGLMVNYHYDLARIEERSQTYGATGNAPMSAKVKKLIKR